jgi:hypothetical protein
MPAEFNKMGISFLYPDNWVLDENDAKAGQESVTVFSPGGAFWSVSVHPISTDPRRLVKSALKAMEDEYKELEIDPIRQTISEQTMIGYEISFYYLDLINTAQVLSFRGRGASYAVFWQAEDRELKSIQDVFLAITTSFVSSLSGHA